MENRVEFKNHPIIIFQGIGGVITFLLIIGFQNIRKIMDSKDGISSLTSSGEVIFYIIFLILVLILSIILPFFKWKNSRIFVDSDNISYEYKGFFNNTQKQVSIKDVSSINIKTTMVDNIFGVRKLQLDINSAETAKSADYKIVLSLENAEKFKAMIEMTKEKMMFSEDHIIKDVDREITSEEISQSTLNTLKENTYKNESNKVERNSFPGVVYSFTILQCLRHIILNISIVSILLFVGGTILSFSKFGEENQDTVGIIIAGLIIVGPVVVDIAKNAFRFINFSVERRKDTIRINYGFLSTQSYIVPIKNIISIGTYQKLIPKIFGYECIHINTVGMGNEKGESCILSIYMKKKDIQNFAERIIPEFKVEDDFVGQSLKVFIYQFIKNSVILTLILAVFAYVLRVYWLIFIGIPICFVISYIRYLTIGIMIAEDYIVIKNGFFSTKTQTIYFDHIDQVVLIKGIYYNFAGFERIEMKSRGKSGNEVNSTGYYKVGTFKEIIYRFLN